MSSKEVIVVYKCQQCPVLYWHWDWDENMLQKLSEEHMMKTGHTIIKMSEKEKMEMGLYL